MWIWLKGSKWGRIVGISIAVTFLAILLGWGYQHINWTTVNPWIYKAQKFYKNGGDVYFGLFFTTFIIYLIYEVLKFRKDPERFTEDVWKIRKTYYVMYLVLAATGFIAGYLSFRDWKTMTQLTAFVVFVDLAVFQTPSITKIWSAEFQHRGKIEKVIEGNVEFINSTAIKFQAFSDVIKQTESYFSPITVIPQNWNAYQKELKQYVGLYTSKFRFRLELFPFKVEVDETHTKDNLRNALNRLEILFFHEIDDTPTIGNEPSYRTCVVEKLMSGEGVVLETDKLVIVPIFQKKNLLIGLRSSDGSKIDEIDITNIINLSTIFHWYL
ncbi:type II toxin-antitoxin system SpoIISA family toxin [Paenibacillus sp. 19GGS1-52]|uniref:type II toxin-antitoxin system SpoIISA family toxin n=1 Tax=Paenibacillus sp. 19GGS1-52 TaxID=2758563 RepID=UPI001EFACD27|nr:type II toxin-antitoxin system SpoIISA family toxin [Paenibacillus sp. 19GGS1-52]ULO07156.1 type II toxin-antitoxin system SpoIISA family toxin [Paenibacillus sp. 19GGS1-52]